MKIDSGYIAALVGDAVAHLACELPRDVSDALEDARCAECSPLATYALNVLCANDAVSRTEHAPICQDTGTVWVCLEVGPDCTVDGDVFAGVDAAVAEAYTAHRLRKSLVRDALLDRTNTEDNTPAFCELKTSPLPGARLHIMLKGGGSDNASRVVMLPPGSGRDGIVDAVVSCVREKGANACPPLIVGVGIGSTFDKVGGLAKRALMRTIGSPAASEAEAEFEAELLKAVNETGVGAAGLGGAHTALAVHVLTAPCHIAALPVAINLGCSALRRTTIELSACATCERAVAPRPDEGMGERHGCMAVDLTVLNPRHLRLPLVPDEVASLTAGEVCLLTGPLYTLRDAGHIRLLEELDARGTLPYGLDGQAIFYAGPTPPACGRPFGAVGPTTASRMDFAAPRLHYAGVRATIGKGHRSEEVRQACAATGSVYFTAIGGAAAYLARCVEESTVVAYPELGTEALRRIVVRDLPVCVGIDVKGASLYG